MSSPAPASASEAVSTLRSQLTALSTGGASHRELGEKYRSILDSVLTWKETDLVEGLKAFIEAIINENVSLVISRQVEDLTPVANLALFDIALIYLSILTTIGLICTFSHPTGNSFPTLSTI